MKKVDKGVSCVNRTVFGNRLQCVRVVHFRSAVGASELINSIHMLVCKFLVSEVFSNLLEAFSFHIYLHIQVIVHI